MDAQVLSEFVIKKKYTIDVDAHNMHAQVPVQTHTVALWTFEKQSRQI